MTFALNRGFSCHLIWGVCPDQQTNHIFPRQTGSLSSYKYKDLFPWFLVVTLTPYEVSCDPVWYDWHLHPGWQVMFMLYSVSNHPCNKSFPLQGLERERAEQVWVSRSEIWEGTPVHTGTVPWSSGYYDVFSVNGRRSLAENLEWERYSEVLGRRRMSGGTRTGLRRWKNVWGGVFMREKGSKWVGGGLEREEVWGSQRRYGEGSRVVKSVISSQDGPAEWNKGIVRAHSTLWVSLVSWGSWAVGNVYLVEVGCSEKW